jgi:hypothetical protein
MNTVHPNRIKVYFPDARVLTETDISDLPPEKRREENERGDNGVWLEVDTATAEVSERENRLCVRIGEDDEENRGIWLDFFCPEDQCVISSPSDVP